MPDNKNPQSSHTARVRPQSPTKVARSYKSRIVSETIDVAPDMAYDFARQMENLPKWASGLATGIQPQNGRWFTESPMGKVQVNMAPRNKFRVLDHDVTLPDGSTVHNAFRVTPAGDGSVLSFVVLRLPGVTAKAFAKDVAHVKSDLKALKAVLEQGA